MSLKSPLGIILVSVLATCVLFLPAHSQSFSVATTVLQNADQFSYKFTLNYDQLGQVQALTDSIYDWSFFVDPATPVPTAITVPNGWKYSYDPAGGEFDFYTEGLGGFGNGDYGPDVIQAGASLSGYGLTTPAAPDLSIAFATDEQFNQDATTATLPTAIPASVPEFSTGTSLGLGIIGLSLVTLRRRILVHGIQKIDDRYIPVKSVRRKSLFRLTVRRFAYIIKACKIPRLPHLT